VRGRTPPGGGQAYPPRDEVSPARGSISHIRPALKSRSRTRVPIQRDAMPTIVMTAPNTERRQPQAYRSFALSRVIAKTVEDAMLLRPNETEISPGRVSWQALAISPLRLCENWLREHNLEVIVFIEENQSGRSNAQPTAPEAASLLGATLKVAVCRPFCRFLERFRACLVTASRSRWYS
jgi:hypothetical protein